MQVPFEPKNTLHCLCLECTGGIGGIAGIAGIAGIGDIGGIGSIRGKGYKKNTPTYGRHLLHSEYNGNLEEIPRATDRMRLATDRLCVPPTKG